MRHFTTLISAKDLLARIGNPDWRVVDCRFELLEPAKGRLDYLSGHVPGAVYADLDKDLADPVRDDSGRHPLPDVRRFAKTLGRWGISNSSQVVAYDQASGAIAARLWWLLRWLGHADVAVLNGGMAAWHRAGGSIEQGEPVPVEVRFTGAADNSMVLGTSELAANLESIRLVDARDSQRFLGRAEPIDAIAGHVPGALNLPFSECLGPDGRMLAANDLAKLWGRMLGEPARGPWAAMCGSGVTACHLALSAEIAGMPAPRLYAGSWSEWIRDPRRPVATEDG
jgi:thiosulfate/3-mercaptopyruvate sulfurtransferase